MTVTRAFGFTLDTQTGAVERWAAGDPASVAEHLPSHRPSGSQCVQCVNRASDCSGLGFAAMRPAGRPDADGVQRVACAGYRRGDALPTLAQIRDKPGPLADAAAVIAAIEAVQE